MRISAKVLYTSAALGVSILGACSGGSSPSNFAPSGPMLANGGQSESNPRSQASATTYYMLSLATLGGKQNAAAAINRRNQITGFSFLKGNTVQHAELWKAYKPSDLGTLGGPNSSANGFNHNTSGQFVGRSEVAQTDPFAENFCGYGTTNICLGFSWQNGAMTALPTLGGNNSAANDVNNRGDIVGVAEIPSPDPNCVAPQVLDYYGVIWKANGTIVTLPPLSGDIVSYANSIRGSAVVGYSGPCSVSAHAVLWQTGSAINLGSLGGSFNNIAYDVNNHGQVVGQSDISGDTATHAFIWQNGTMSDLGTLSGDINSYALGINDKGQVVGQSCNASSCRGFIWQNGTMTDLNSLIPPNRNLYIFYGGDINNAGHIIGGGLNLKGLERAVVLVPGKMTVALRNRVSAPPFEMPRMHSQLRNVGAAGHGRWIIRL